MKNRFYTLGVGLFCAMIPTVTYVFLKMTWAASMELFREALGIAVFLFVFLHLGALKTYILSLPGRLKAAYAVFFFIICAGHCFGIPRTTFPFIPWDMFSVETHYTDRVHFFRYQAITQGGRKLFLHPEAYYRSLANGRLVTDLDRLVFSATEYDPSISRPLFKRKEKLIEDYREKQKQGGLKAFLACLRLNTFEEHLTTPEQNKQHLNQVLEAIALRYNAWHPQDPLTGIDVIKGIIDISQGAQAKPVFSQVWHFSFSKGDY